MRNGEGYGGENRDSRSAERSGDGDAASRSTSNLQLSVVRDQRDETQRYSAFSVLPYEDSWLAPNLNSPKCNEE